MSANMMQVLVFIAILLEINGDSLYHDTMKKGCYDQICWKDNTYPREKINDQINNVNFLERFSARQSRQTFIDNSSPSCNLCNTALSLRIEPLSIIDAGIKYYLLHNEHYGEMKIELNVCAAEQDSSTCHMKMDRLNQRYQCEQKTTQMSVITYNSFNNTFVGKSFAYPSACECLLTTEELTSK